MCSAVNRGVTRRQLIGAGVGGSVALLAEGSLGPALAATDARARRRLRDQVKHVVVLTQENRSFDSYFGTLRGVVGFADPHPLILPSGKPVFYQPAPNSVGYELPFHMDTHRTSSACVADLSHAWIAQHLAYNRGQMDNWVPAHIAVDGATNGPLTMGYYNRADLPWHYALADAFTIGDGYHCSVMGPTNPNRLYLMSGTIDPNGKHGGPVIDNAEAPPYTWTTYPERLQAAGVSWRVYQEVDNFDDNALVWFRRFQNAARTSPLYKRGLAFQSSVVDRFTEDVTRDRLPTVSWIIGPDYSTEHPSYLPAAGAAFMNDMLSALRDNPDVWRKTVVIVNYDENDGYFDHVRPPAPVAGTAGEYINPVPPSAYGVPGPIGLGFRVPMIAISPWSAGGHACGDRFDHTSCLRFIERLTGVYEPNISAWRRARVGDLVSAFDFSRAPDEFPDLPSPDALPVSNPGDANVNAEQSECFVAPGGSGNPPPAPPAPTAQTVPTQEPGTRPRRGKRITAESLMSQRRHGSRPKPRRRRVGG